MSQTKDIRDAVENELGYDPLVDDADITVRNINGDVALNGTVPSYPQYLEAAAAVRRVAGVKKVQNHLEVVLPTGNCRDDALLTTTANNALTLNIAVPDGVEATARDGNLTLTLTGTVDYGTQRERRHPDRPRPHLGRARRGGRRGLDGHRRLRRHRQPARHRLTFRYRKRQK